jgi:hypothetical protein
VGDPTKPGPYAIRVKFPGGTKVMPPKHPEGHSYTACDLACSTWGSRTLPWTPERRAAGVARMRASHDGGRGPKPRPSFEWVSSPRVDIAPQLGSMGRRPSAPARVTPHGLPCLSHPSPPQSKRDDNVT